MSLIILEVVQFLIENGPGRTQRELSEAIFASDGYQQRVNVECGLLVQRGLVDCRGNGTPSDPYTYYPKA
jgi:hypothetical protein